jgi:hypothetical protein
MFSRIGFSSSGRGVKVWVLRISKDLYTCSRQASVVNDQTRACVTEL